jgi:hypothetical protein
MGHAGEANELLEVLRDELRPVVGDHAQFLVGMHLVDPLQDALDVGLGHRLADLPVHETIARHGVTPASRSTPTACPR